MAKNWFFFALLGYTVLIISACSASTPSPPPTKSVDEVLRSQGKDPNSIKASPPVALSKPSAPYKPPVGLQWDYYTEADPMGKGTQRTASTVSLNTLEFDFPYAEPQHGTLYIRRHPRYGKNVFFKIERGQFMCGFTECSIIVRFDKGKTQTYAANGPADSDTTVLFIQGFDRFVSQVKKAKTVNIEATYYQEGSRVLTFDVSGYKDK